MTKHLIIVCLVAFNSLLFAQDIPQNYHYILKQLDLAPDDVEEYLLAFKTRPDLTSETIVVVPEIIEKEEDYYSQYKPHILIVNSDTGKIISSYSPSQENPDESEWFSDAIAITEVKIHTETYMLQEGNRAFGIRFIKRNFSNPNPLSLEILSLYEFKNKKLKTVLDDFQIYFSGGEWDTQCAGEFYENDANIKMKKTQTNGYRDMQIEYTEETTLNSIDHQGDCVSESVLTENSVIYVYNGEKYVREETESLPAHYQMEKVKEENLD